VTKLRALLNERASVMTEGSASFQVFVPNADPKLAFRDAVKAAQEEHGSGGYSGTIAEKEKYTVRSSDPLTKAQALKVIKREIGDNDKWGPAWAIPIADTAKTQDSSAKIVGWMFYGMASS
jgi:hypothetical protein